MLGSAHVKNHSAGDSPMGLATLNIIRHYILFFLFKPKQNRKTLVLAEVWRVDRHREKTGAGSYQQVR